MSQGITSLKELFDKTHEITDAKAAAISISNKVEGGSFTGLTEITDMVFYREMWRRDPEMAKAFISTQINKLNDKVTSLNELRNTTKEEIKELEKLLNYRSDKAINTYIKSTTITKNWGLTSSVSAWFRENIGKPFDMRGVLKAMKSQGVPNASGPAVSQAMYKLHERGVISKKGRGVYVMEESDV